MTSKAKKKKPLQINASTTKGSLYSNIVHITGAQTGSNSDVIFDFIFKHPLSEEGDVIARITLPTEVAKNMGKIILENEQKSNQ